MRPADRWADGGASSAAASLLGRIVTEQCGMAVLPSHGGHNSHSAPALRSEGERERLDDGCWADADRWADAAHRPLDESPNALGSAVQTRGVAHRSRSALSAHSPSALVATPINSTSTPTTASLLVAMSRAGAGSLRERMQQGAAAKKMQADKFVGLVEKKSDTQALEWMRCGSE